MSDLDPNPEGAKFLERDFNQCFEQMRHYDNQIIEIIKFAVTAYGLIGGASLAFYRYGLEKTADYRAPAIALLTVGLLFGVILLALVARTRTYFVLVARYVNEHRAFFLKDKPLGFVNQTRMYMNPAQPPYFNWRSSQELLLYGLALLNSGLLALGLYLVFDESWSKWPIVSAGAVLLLGLQLGVAIRSLRSREGKSASEAVFNQG